MKRQILISFLILLTIQTFASAAVLYVPSRDYPTIQSAINAANPLTNDVVVVAPGTYTGPGNVDLDFGGKAITVRSQINLYNPEPGIIAATIIDCQGTRYNPHRAFYFRNGEGADSKVLGFTIRNGYGRGPAGAAGQFGYIGVPVSLFVPIPPCDDPLECPPYALNGANASGDGYGGAILCAGASPTIRYCVISNCTVTGAQGGDGADGLSGEWDHWTISDFNMVDGTLLPDAEMEVDVPDGQWGGTGGSGSGNGYGGAIACLNDSSPIISDCTISDNFARGGCGGDGGDGGNAWEPPDYDEGLEGGGGNAGNSIGDGIGGGIYCDGASSPAITNCTFSNNIAATGIRGTGGQRGLGNEDDPRAPEGLDSLVYPAGGIAGGAAYYSHPSNANFINCTFTGNKAYEAYVFYDPFLGEDISAYTVGGALYSDVSNIVTLDDCKFIGNLGGAVYCDSGCNLNFDDCLFTDNSETANGGALYVGPGGTVDLQNCIFGGNSAYDDGGALECKSNITLKNCSFGNNIADSDNDGWGYGGGVDVYRYNAPAPLTINVSNCSFSGNQSIYGGGFSSENFDATFTDCYFIGNTALEGGGLDLVNGDVSVTGGVVKGNNATDGDGGGFNCRYSIAEIRDCTITDNFADGVYPAGGSGGAINFYGGASTQEVFNCLITGNYATIHGGAISCYSATPEIGNCTFSDNLAGGYGGAIFSDWASNPQITDSIFQNNNSHAIHEEDVGGNAIVTFSLFYDNPDGDYYESDTSTSYDFGSVADPNGNFNKDPLFVSGDLGGYYLSQIAAGQGSNSPAVDNGSDTAAKLGLDTYTTRTDNAGDSGQVDIGYHYIDIADVGTFQLTASVIGGNGTIEPTSGTYYAGTVVTLTATPGSGWLVKAWSGTDDDSSTAKTNSVVMNSDRTVTVEFEQPKTLIVAVGGGGEGFYSNITDALHDAEDGDIIVVYPGVYYGPQVQVNKDVEIRSQHPDDPNWVEQTIIDSTGHAGPVFLFDSDRGPGCILNGFTIQNSDWYTDVGDDGENPGENGEDGPGAEGGAIWIGPGAGPVIKNCVIRDNKILGGFGGDGFGADTTHNAGRGGWGGWARGGAIYCGTNSSPTFINCQIIDNQAVGGLGGDGGDWDPPSGNRANYGGNWSRAEWWNIDPRDTTIEWVQGDLWEKWGEMAQPPFGTVQESYYVEDGQIHWGYFGDYRWYSGYGGAVFINRGSNVTFIDCTISGNLAQGGLSGLGGDEPGAGPQRVKPFPRKYEIPSFGGGVYCAAEATVTFNGCTITDNTSSDPSYDHTLDAENADEGDRIEEEYEPDNPYSIDPYLGHGGGVCAEDTATVIFTDCTFSENEAAVGGGIHGGSANLKVSDCEFISNSAYQGGGLFAERGPVTILRSNFTDNEAVSDPNDPNVVILGSGGGLHLWATEADIIDCNIRSNQAEASGGGAYFGGEGAPLLTNCLLTDNTAGRDGGGVSTNIFTQLTISNCTIAENIVTGVDFGTGYGGGLYCSYDSYTNIINSIIWGNVGNVGAQGSQLAIGTAFKYDPGPSTVNVTYSDIQDATDPNAFGARIEALDLVFCIDSTGSMFDDIDAVKDAAYEITGAIVTEIPDSRIAVVEYKDFNQPNLDPAITDRYGDETDYPYRTVLGFTTDTSEVVAALDSLTASGGADWPESVYTALMHCIDHNSLAEALDGELYGADPASMGPGAWRSGNVMRVIILMGDAPPHDPEPFTYYTLEDIIAAVGVSGIEPKRVVPLLIGDDAEAASYFESLAERTRGTVLQVAGAEEVVEALMEAIELISRIPDPILVEAGCILNWDPNSYSWDPDSHNIDEDPYFVSGYYLSQIAAGQPVDSPCVDAGSDLSANLGLNIYTTRTDRIFDKGIVDMGYHYPLALAESCRISDLVLDGVINFRDFAIFALNWLEEGCSDANDWCQGADFTFDTYVNFEDLDIFVECWLFEDTEAPIPNPSEWEIEPYSMSTTSISMTAKTAFDVWWGGDVQYYFECVSGDCDDSGWQEDPNYENSNLVPGAECGYKVRARDASEQIPDDGTGEPGNKTGWSLIRYAVVGEEEDLNPPTPNPMTWAVPSYTATPNSITLFSTTATDDTSGVEYYFENFYAPVYNSGWIGVPTWTDTGLTPDTTYTYRVRARDTSVNQNQTGWSTLLDANTLPEGVVPDTTPPDPDPMQWAEGGEPEEVDGGGGASDYYAQMTAVVATDPSGVQYRFICTTNSGFSSGWQSSPTYIKLVGMAGQAHMFYVIAHDLSPIQNETGPSSTVAAIPRL